MNKYSTSKSWAATQLPKMYALLLLLSAVTLQAQNRISGTVSDANGSLPGVTIQLKNKPTTTLSDENGNYTINALPTDILVFSFIGFKTQTYQVANKTTINVQLAEDATTLQEVIVNAGYYSVKEKERTGSIAKITTKDIEKQPVTNVLATMQGRMAGVNITQTSGVPGGGFDIQIRGQNSLRTDGNSPLYIIDAVPYSSETVGNSRSTGVIPGFANPLNSINPNDIESIEVLKDADATAIYGSRGANGVVLITTKKGKAGKIKFTTSIKQGAGNASKFMELLNTKQYLEMRREAFKNDGLEPDFLAYDINGTWNQNRYTNWQKELIGKTALFNDINASVSGGSTNTQFLISGTYHHETTVFPGPFGYNRAVIRSNLNHSTTDNKFKISFSTAFTNQNNKQPATDLSSIAIQLAPNAPKLYNTDGTLNWECSTWENPLALLEGKYKTNTFDGIANAVLSYNIASGLDIKTSLGMTDTRHTESRTQPSTLYDPAYEAGPEFSSVFLTNTSRRTWIAEPQINWAKSWKYGKTEILLGTTFQQQKGQKVTQQADGFASNSLIYNLSAAFSTITLQDQPTDYKYQAFFGRANYNYKDRYFLNVTARRDGSSRFGPNKQFANFGAVGAAWIFSKETVFNNHKTISFGKLRASYGTTGNDLIGDYQFLDTYLSSGINYGGAIGLQPSRLFNPNFGWETNKKLEVALDMGFLKDKLTLSIATYNNRSSSQLVGIPMPATTGFPTLQANLNATVQNQGYEIAVRTVNIQNTNLNWTTNFNISFAKNKLLAFPNLEGSTYRNQLVIGEALNIRKVYQYTGLNSSTGLFTFKDTNNDGIITALDRQTVQDFNPSFFGGLSNQFSFKNWQIDFLFQFVKQQNYTASAMVGIPGTLNNQPIEVLQRWQTNGDIGGYQQYTAGYNSSAVDAAYKYYDSDAVISDASFVRLKNAAISYSLNEKWLSGMQCRFTIEGQNLLTFTKYKGRDPEFKTTGYLPPLRIIMAGIQFTF